jgi:hypothetical protein
VGVAVVAGVEAGAEAGAEVGAGAGVEALLSSPPPVAGAAGVEAAAGWAGVPGPSELAFPLLMRPWWPPPPRSPPLPLPPRPRPRPRPLPPLPLSAPTPSPLDDSAPAAVAFSSLDPARALAAAEPGRSDPAAASSPPSTLMSSLEALWFLPLGPLPPPAATPLSGLGCAGPVGADGGGPVVVGEGLGGAAAVVGLAEGEAGTDSSWPAGPADALRAGTDAALDAGDDEATVPAFGRAAD